MEALSRSSSAQFLSFLGLDCALLLVGFEIQTRLQNSFGAVIFHVIDSAT